jgi:dTMP kinase
MCRQDFLHKYRWYGRSTVLQRGFSRAFVIFVVTRRRFRLVLSIKFLSHFFTLFSSLVFEYYFNNNNSTIMIVSNTAAAASKATSTKRGAFIVFEGVDRCGKTTQVGLLVKHLLVQLGLAAVAMRFPDRTTLVGQLINQYLQSQQELDDRAVHLLFSANRWEVAPTLTNHLESGTTVVCDRYAYSGVAFSSAKPSLADDLSWCQACDVGLPAPDAVIFLDLSQEEAEQRGG